MLQQNNAAAYIRKEFYIVIYKWLIKHEMII